MNAKNRVVCWTCFLEILVFAEHTGNRTLLNADYSFYLKVNHLHHEWFNCWRASIVETNIFILITVVKSFVAVQFVSWRRHWPLSAMNTVVRIIATFSFCMYLHWRHMCSCSASSQSLSVISYAFMSCILLHIYYKAFVFIDWMLPCKKLCLRTRSLIGVFSRECLAIARSSVVMSWMFSVRVWCRTVLLSPWGRRTAIAAANLIWAEPLSASVKINLLVLCSRFLSDSIVRRFWNLSFYGMKCLKINGCDQWTGVYTTSGFALGVGLT